MVVTGDYKRAFDQTCEGFQSLQCDTLITESTFAHPIYNWPSFDSVITIFMIGGNLIEKKRLLAFFLHIRLVKLKEYWLAYQDLLMI